jgi:hypothetical protein
MSLMNFQECETPPRSVEEGITASGCSEIVKRMTAFLEKRNFFINA